MRKDANDVYSARRLRVSALEIRDLRSALLLTVVKSFEPDVVLVDKHPFGASGEFKSALKALRRTGGRTVLGLRDILDEPKQVLYEWHPRKMQQRIAKFYDRVLIYGDRAVFDPVKAYAFPRSLAERTRFCGYVVCQENPLSLENFEWPFPPSQSRSRPVVLATTGGGEDGFRTLEHFIRASAGAPWDAVAIAGPMTPDTEMAILENLAAEAGVRFRHFVPHLSALFGYIDAIVCMGGYNTLVEAAALGVPAVCVPRVNPRVEQLMRAEAFEKLRLLQVCRPEHLSPQRLRAAIRVALNTSPHKVRVLARASLSFEGAARAANVLLKLARRRARVSLSELPSEFTQEVPA